MALFTVGMLSLGFSPLNVHAEEEPITTTVISPAWNDDGSLKTDEAFAKPGYDLIYNTKIKVDENATTFVVHNKIGHPEDMEKAVVDSVLINNQACNLQIVEKADDGCAFHITGDVNQVKGKEVGIEYTISVGNCHAPYFTSTIEVEDGLSKPSKKTETPYHKVIIHKHDQYGNPVKNAVFEGVTYGKVETEDINKTPIQPVELLLCLDDSGSMTGRNKESMIESLCNTSDGVLKDFFNFNINNRVRLIPFASSSTICRTVYVRKDSKTAPLKSTDTLLSEIRGYLEGDMGVGGGTAFEPPLRKTLEACQTTPKGYQRYMIFLSDGDSTDDPTSLMSQIKTTYPDLTVSSVAFGSDASASGKLSIITANGGVAVQASDRSQLTDQFRKMTESVNKDREYDETKIPIRVAKNKTYSINYRPKDGEESTDQLVTDENGDIIIYGWNTDYAMKFWEVEAPEGYTMDSDTPQYTYLNIDSNKDAKAGEMSALDGFTNYNSMEKKGVIPCLDFLNRKVHNYTVEKIWKNDIEDGRPEKITVSLLADGEPVESIDLTKEDEWKGKFQTVPYDKDGVDIEYTVQEDNVEGYVNEIKLTDENFTITNSRVVELTVEKIWKEDREVDRPEQLNVRLLGEDGEVIEEIALNAENEWKGVFKEVPVYKDGQKIKYTVEEAEVRGYTGEIKETDTGFEIINTKIPPEKIELPSRYVKKDPPATAVETINMLPLIAGDLVVLGFILKKRK